MPDRRASETTRSCARLGRVGNLREQHEAEESASGPHRGYAHGRVWFIHPLALTQNSLIKLVPPLL